MYYKIWTLLYYYIFKQTGRSRWQLLTDLPCTLLCSDLSPSFNYLASMWYYCTPPFGLQLYFRNLSLMAAVKTLNMGTWWMVYHSHKVNNLWPPCDRSLGSIWWCQPQAMSVHCQQPPDIATEKVRALTFVSPIQIAFISQHEPTRRLYSLSSLHHPPVLFLFSLTVRLCAVLYSSC